MKVKDLNYNFQAFGTLMASIIAEFIIILLLKFKINQSNFRTMNLEQSYDSQQILLQMQNINEEPNIFAIDYRSKVFATNDSPMIRDRSAYIMPIGSLQNKKSLFGSSDSEKAQGKNIKQQQPISLVRNSRKGELKSNSNKSQVETQQTSLKTGNRKKKKGSSTESQEFVIEQNSTNKSKRLSSQTKNIAKNFGKAIICFIAKNNEITEPLFQNKTIHKQFLRKVLQFKWKIITIKGLRSFWMEQFNPFAKEVRILSALFLRKYFFSYVFNSRVQNFRRNIKYRVRMLEGLANPDKFTFMKEY